MAPNSASDSLCCFSTNKSVCQQLAVVVLAIVVCVSACPRGYPPWSCRIAKRFSTAVTEEEIVHPSKHASLNAGPFSSLTPMKQHSPLMTFGAPSNSRAALNGRYSLFLVPLSQDDLSGQSQDGSHFMEEASQSLLPVILEKLKWNDYREDRPVYNLKK